MNKKSKNTKRSYKKLFFIPVSLFVVAVFLGGGGLDSKANRGISVKGKTIEIRNRASADLDEAIDIKKPTLKSSGQENIALSAESFLVVDRETFSPLVEKNENKRLPVASITKLMTAVVALENKKTNDVVQIDSTFPNAPSSRIGLYVGEKITLESVLKGMLISSGNDAAEATAEFVSNGNYNKFVSLMNKRAGELGMKNSHFSNAMGLDNSSNYSTAEDLIYLSAYALENDFISATVKQSEAEISSVDGKTKHPLRTTNELLFDKELSVLGIKTGQTPEAGGCLVTLTKTKNSHEIMAVILGSSDRFGETKQLIRWVEENIEWK